MSESGYQARGASKRDAGNRVRGWIYGVLEYWEKTEDEWEAEDYQTVSKG